MKFLPENKEIHSWVQQLDYYVAIDPANVRIQCTPGVSQSIIAQPDLITILPCRYG